MHDNLSDHQTDNNEQYKRNRHIVVLVLDIFSGIGTVNQLIVASDKILQSEA